MSEQERAEAPHLKRALELGKQAVLAGENPVPLMEQHLNANTSGQIDYIQLLSYPELTEDFESEVILALAVQFEKARLIDNLIFNVKGN